MSNPTTPHPGLSYRQFVGMIAAMTATNALAIDTMLPALGQIGTSLGIVHANNRQWIITAFMLGFGAAQIVYGTLADRYGRRPVLIISLFGYIACSLLCAVATSFETMMLARILQGIAAAGTRVLATAIVRDCYEGRTMARVNSFVFIIFLGVPILAPSLGQIIMLAFPWPGIFILLAVYASVVTAWVVRKLPETLHPADRAPIEFAKIAAAFTYTLQNRLSLGYTIALTLAIGGMFGYLNSSQQIFAVSFHAPRLFPLVFALNAGFIAIASLVNTRLVTNLGSRLISHAALLGFIAVAILHIAVAALGNETIWSFAALQCAQLFFFGLMVGNFGAMSMEPLGHIAGTAASVQGFISTLGGALLGFVTGHYFNGTTIPVAGGFTLYGLGALAAVLYAEQGRLFHARQQGSRSFFCKKRTKKTLTLAGPLHEHNHR